MRAAITRPTLALVITLAGVLGAFGSYGCFGGKALTDPTNVNPGTGFKPPQSKVAVVTISPSSISGRPGDSTLISATIKDSSGAVVTDSSVAWSSTDSSVASVSANGHVRFWHRGRSWIGIRVGGFGDSVPTTVSDPVLASIQLSPTSIKGVPGNSTQITAVFKDSTGAVMATPPAISWASSNTSIATVSSSGMVKLSKQGAASITASATGVTANVGVTVDAPPVGPVANIALSPAAITGVPGNTAQVTAALSDANGNPVTGVTVAWSSSSTSIASVSSSGLVTLVKQGAATITATASGVTATIGATVNAAPVASIAMSPASITGLAGTTSQITAVLKDASGNTVVGPTVSWTSSNATAANVSSSGLVTLAKQGTATITASASGVSGTVGVTVNAIPVAAIVLSPTSVSGVPGNSMQLSASVQDASGNPISGATVTWSSSSSAVAGVSGSGMVTLVKQGTATVTAAAGGVTSTAGVTVNAAAAPTVASVTVSPASTSVTAGSSVQLTATALDGSGNVVTGAAVSWSSSNTGEATVSGTGLVQALTAGAVIISATSGGHVATANVQVMAAASGGGGSSGSANEPSGFISVINTGALVNGPTGSNQSWSTGGAIPVSMSLIEGTPTSNIGLSSAGASEPQSSGYRIYFPAGATNDAAVAVSVPFTPVGGGSIYARWKLRLGATWSTTAMNALSSKLFAPKDVNSSNPNDDIIMAYLPATPTNYVAGVGLQGPTETNVPNLNAGEIPSAADVFNSGQWNTFEVLITADSPNGAGNGSVTMWVNGVKSATRSGVSIFSASQTAQWRNWSIYASRAVYSGVQTSSTYEDLDALYVSVSPH